MEQNGGGTTWWVSGGHHDSEQEDLAWGYADKVRRGGSWSTHCVGREALLENEGKKVQGKTTTTIYRRCTIENIGWERTTRVDYLWAGLQTKYSCFVLEIAQGVK